MTNEQLTQNVVDLLNYKAKAEEEHDMFKSMLQNMGDDIKETKKLAEDVHIMAINMQNLQKSQEEANRKIEETNQKVDAITSKEFMEYKENKKILKQNLSSGFIGAGVTLVIGIITWLAKEFIMKGGI